VAVPTRSGGMKEGEELSKSSTTLRFWVTAACRSLDRFVSTAVLTVESEARNSLATAPGSSHAGDRHE
jgi:hypothetical protein